MLLCGVCVYLSGQEIGCVCLQEDAVEGDLADRVTSLVCPRVGDESREAHTQVGKLLQEGLDHWVTVGETVSVEKKGKCKSKLKNIAL